MVRKQLQSSLGVSTLKGIDPYGTNRKPNCAGGLSLFFAFLDPVNPVSSDCPALNRNGVLQHKVYLPFLDKRQFSRLESMTGAGCAG
jgi:hypothetical protein